MLNPRQVLVAFALAMSLGQSSLLLAAEPILVAHFQTDASPEIGQPLAYDRCREVTQPLTCRGLVLFGEIEPIVLCTVDWIGLANESQDVFRQRLADLAGTSIDRVVVHALHQHDAPRCDLSAYRLLEPSGRAEAFYEQDLLGRVLSRIASVIGEAKERATPVTRFGLGEAEVFEVASNRRILGSDGRVRATRYTACKDAALREEPVGVIDPMLKMLILASDDHPVAALSAFATHPQSYYRTGKATTDFPGMARDARQTVTDTFHLHFTGAGGNIGAGKFNDGSVPLRQRLAERLEDAMQRAWYATELAPLSARDITWRFEEVTLPLNPSLDVRKLEELVNAQDTPPDQLVHAAEQLAFAQRMLQGRKIPIGCLQLKECFLLFLPGELFVEYQLAAQAMRPDAKVWVAAYGDYGPFYIGTRVAYPQGGYETSDSASNVSPEVEEVLLGAMKRLLQVPSSNITASDFTERGL